MTTLTPAVHDAFWKAGYAFARADLCDVAAALMFQDGDEGEVDDAQDAFNDGWSAFTPEAEAERVEMVHQLTEPDIKAANDAARYVARRHRNIDDTQGQVPDASMVMGWGDD